jgi:GINS complex subunit 2
VRSSLIQTEVRDIRQKMEGLQQVATGQLALQKAEFLAEDELIEISPMVKANIVSLVCGDFGPFEPSIATCVPLWLALALKKVRRCKILPPRWLRTRAIEQVMQEEREIDSQLQPLPRYFSEVRYTIARAIPGASVVRQSPLRFQSDFLT